MTLRRENGFTLIEVLAALLIFSLAIIGLTAAGTHSARSVSVLDQKMLAGLVADNVLTNARYERLQIGTRSGSEEQMSRRFEWDLLTQTTEVDGFLRMTVSVRTENGDQVLIARTAYRSERKRSARLTTGSPRNSPDGDEQ